MDALDLGATVELQITATVDGGTSGTAITNRARISGADMADLLSDDNAAEAVVHVVSVDIGLGKSATPSSPAENGLVTYAIVATIFAEYAGARRGLGIYILQAKNTFRPDLVLAAVLVSAGLTLALLALIGGLARLTARGPEARHD